MIDHPPSETPARSWAVFCIWSLAVLATIPLGRRLQAWVSDAVGRSAFLYVVLAAVALGLVWAFVALWSARRSLRRHHAMACVAVGGCFVYAAWARRQAPEEALHFVQYGVLGLLAFRALTHSMKDSMIYPSSVVVCASVGLLDETVQWLTPGRFFAFSDVWMNAKAAVLSQAGIAFGLSPAYIRWRPAASSAATASSLAMGLLVAIGLCSSNTPAFVQWYASKLPALEFLTRIESVMSEFGYRYEDPRIGVFYSRLTLAELEEQDRTRAGRIGPILDAYREPERYLDFLARYTAGRDPFAHETRVHLFSRDWHIYAAEEGIGDGTVQEHWTIAYRENQILEAYFSETLQSSQYRWTAEQVRELEAKTLPEFPFTSLTGADMVTRYRLWELWLLLGGLFVVLAVIRRWLRKLALLA